MSSSFLKNVGDSFARFGKTAGGKLADFGHDVSNQTRLMADQAQLKREIRSEQEKLEKTYAALGKNYYERRKKASEGGEAVLAEDASFFDSIDASLQTIAQKQAAYDKLDRAAQK